MTSETIEVLDPTVLPQKESTLLADRPETLNGSIVGLLANGKRNSEETTNEQIDTNSVIQDEKNTPSSELNSDEVTDNDSVDEVAPDDLNSEDGEPEDKEESS